MNDMMNAPEIVTRYAIERNKLVVHHNFTEDLKFVVNDVMLNEEPLVVQNKHNVHIMMDGNIAMYLHNGVLHIAGWDTHGELGVGFHGEHYFDVLYPVLVEGGEQVRLIDIDSKNFYFGARVTFMKYNGYLYAAGNNNNGQLGIGTNEDSAIFQRVMFADGEFVRGDRISELLINNTQNITMTYNNTRYTWGDEKGKHLYPTPVTDSSSQSQQVMKPQTHNLVTMESSSTKAKAVFAVSLVIIVLALLILI